MLGVMFGTSTAWWKAAASPLGPCIQQRSCLAAVHPPVQAAYSAAIPLTHLLNSDGRLGQEVLQHQCQQSSSYFSPSMLDGQVVTNEGLIFEQGGWASASTKLPSLCPAMGSGGSGQSQATQLQGLPVVSQMPPRDPCVPSILHSQLNLKRKHVTYDLNHADPIPCKTRVTDEKMAARLQGLSLSQVSGSAEGAATSATFASTSGAASASPTFASKPVLRCGAWDAQGWKKFHEVEQRLAATEEDSEVSFDRQEAPDSAHGASEDSQLECLRLKLSPELHRQLAITELQTAAIQSQGPQRSLALVLWTAPKEHWQEAGKGAGEAVGSQKEPASTEQIDGAGYAAGKEEEEEPLVELCEDINAGSTSLAMATSAPFFGTEQGSNHIRFPYDNDGFMET